MGDERATGFNRRDFLLRGFRRAVERAGDMLTDRVAPDRPVRPPGALPEAGFLAACVRCGDCASVCPVRAITLLPPESGLGAGTPVLQPASTACIMCPDMPCAAICPTDALVPPDDGWSGVRLASIGIDPIRCITWHDVQCGVCAAACPIGPAALAIGADGHPHPGSACTGCGICIAACVTEPGSIMIERRTA